MSGPVNITQAAAPALEGQPSVNFSKDSFEALIWQKGYRVYHDKATKCPCKVKAHDNLSSCKNCGGSGWIFFNRVETKMILASMNLDTQYKDWAEETLGTVSLTARDSDKIGYMDRITVLDAETLFSEVVYPKTFKNERFARLTYDIKFIETVFLFSGAQNALTKLEPTTDFTFKNNYIVLDPKYNDYDETSITVRYIHAPQYHVVDMPRDTMSSPIKDTEGIPQEKLMPISAVGRRAHYVLDEQSYNGDYLFDNSYATNCE
jgi:hypothetical protein